MSINYKLCVVRKILKSFFFNIYLEILEPKLMVIKLKST